MGASQSTNSSTTTSHDHNGGRKYDVFISFRDEDTGDNFSSHLLDALCRKKIHTFVDYRLERGDEISPVVLKAIEESRISIIIFSKDYASSKWCLRELAEIMKYKKMNKQIVIPVFYHVDPPDVRKQTGRFKHSFVKRDKESPEELQILRNALTEASNISGWHSSVIRPEARLVEEIVKDVSKKLNDASPSSDFRGLVGIHSRIEKVKSLLQIEMLDFRVVGIWGMGGIGKTTIAGVVFDQIYSKFEGCYFIANVREESEKHGGLIHLRDEILSKILEEEINLGTPNVPLFIKRRLQTKRIFLILDDVNNSRQLETLAGGIDQFGPGSRIIITTKDKQLLCNHGVDNVYEAEAFGYHEALLLFCKYGFKQDHPPKDFMEFVNRVVYYAKGNPLALKVVGSSLYGKSKEDWESALHKLNKISNPEIHNLLRISYDALDDEEKNIFLDIACFFKGEYKVSVIQILNCCYFSAQYGLSVLVDKSLISMSSGDITMHDLLHEMGREIVRQESFNKPGKRSRLHNHKDVCDVLERNIGTQAVKGIILDMSKVKKINLSSQAFEKMYNLRFLKFYKGIEHYKNQRNFSNVHLSSDLNYLPEELRYLQWDNYPSKALPSSLSLDYLVELNLSDSNVEQLWEGKKHAPMLKWLILGNSRHLTMIPNLSGSPHLEVIDLEDCKSLLDISSSIQHLNNLHYLRVGGCKNLTSFSSDIYFESLTMLDLSSCINLTKFPPISGNIKVLNLKGTAIEEVPSSIEKLKVLVALYLSFSKKLKHISTNICKLKSLRLLDLMDCSELASFPEILEKMECLVTLDISGTAIKDLPFSIERLSGLSELSLRCCKNLETLPTGICNLRSLVNLDISNCSKLDKLTDNMGNLKSLENLLAGGATVSQVTSSSMTSLKKLVKSSLCSLNTLRLNNCNVMEIPEDIGCLSSLKYLELRGNDFESLPKSIKHLFKLRELRLSNCNKLQTLTELPLCLEYLEAENCKQLQSVLDASKFAGLLTNRFINGESRSIIDLKLMFANSRKLNQKAFSNVLAESLLSALQFMATTGKEYKGVVMVDICYPGSKIPEWFSYQSSNYFVKVQLPQHNWTTRKFLGFALCVVIEFEECCFEDDSLMLPYSCHFKTTCGDEIKHKSHLIIIATRNFKRKIFIDSAHMVLRYHDHSRFKLPRDDYTTCLVNFLPPEKGPVYTVTHCGVCPIYAEANVHQPSSSVEKFGTTIQDVEESMVEERTETMEFPDEADTSGSGSGSGRSDDEEMDPLPKTNPLLNSKFVLPYRNSRKRVGLLSCNCWIFLVSVLCGLCVFGMLVLLLLHLSTLCEIYLSSHVQNMQVRRL